MRWSSSWLVLASLVACTDGTKSVSVDAEAVPTKAALPGEPPPPPGPPKLVVSPPQRVQASGLLVEGPQGEPRFCLVAEDIAPPQCGGMRVVGLDWAKVEGKKQMNGVTWADAHVVGDFDGETLKLAQPPGPQQRPIAEERKTPCERPAGGFDRPNLGLATFDQVYALDAAARALPGYAGMWMNDLEPQTEDAQDMKKVILNVAFTGDAASHTAELRKHWGGALCIVARKHNAETGERIKGEAMNFAGEQLGLTTISADYDETTGLVRVEVEYGDASHQAKLDAEYGAGVVVLESMLRPVPAVLPRAGQACTDGESLADGCECGDRHCMDICCVGSACSHQSGDEIGWAKCISPKKKRGR